MFACTAFMCAYHTYKYTLGRRNIRERKREKVRVKFNFGFSFFFCKDE